MAQNASNVSKARPSVLSNSKLNNSKKQVQKRNDSHGGTGNATETASEIAAVRDAMLKTTQKLFFPSQFKKTKAAMA